MADVMRDEDGAVILDEAGVSIIYPAHIAYSTYIVNTGSGTKTIRAVFFEGTYGSAEESIAELPPATVTRFRPVSKIEDHDFVFADSATQQEIDDTINAYLDTKATELQADITTQRYA